VTWTQVLQTLQAGTDLTTDQARWAMDEVLAGRAPDADLAAFLLALRDKGESAQEVGALVAVMLEHAHRVVVPGVVLDVVGTGGDQSGTVNISTMAAVVCAAAGATVVKHGNRAATSQTGTADVLEALGIRIELDSEQVAQCVADVGIGFCFAPMHHPAMRHAVAVRKSLGVPTVFNILGPLSNPAGAQAALIGSANERLAPVMARTLADRGVRALVVRGADGLDEISLAGETQIWDATGSSVVMRTLDIRAVGLEPRPSDLLAGGDPERNAQLLRHALGTEPGDRAIEAIRDAVAVNAAGGLVAYAAAVEHAPVQSDTDLIDRMRGALGRAREVMASGAAAHLLDRWRQATVR
jgi:anthranilate phosphoribosyltransferase